MIRQQQTGRATTEKHQIIGNPPSRLNAISSISRLGLLPLSIVAQSLFQLFDRDLPFASPTTSYAIDQCQ